MAVESQRVVHSVNEVLSDVRTSTDELINLIQVRGLEIGLRLAGAVLIWIIGRTLVRIALELVDKAALSRGVDETLVRYMNSALNMGLTFLLVMVLLGWVGVETATFAALLAGAGLAIGTAWGGLLQHFAAGMYMVVLRPFRVGDVVSAGGVSGRVDEVGLLVTTITTFDNVKTVVGNNRILSVDIQNYSANPWRRVELSVVLDHGTNLADALARVRTHVEAIENVLESPAPSIEILEFTLAGPKLVVRPFCDNQHYWQVYFDTNRAIQTALSEGGYAVPSQRYLLDAQKSESAPSSDA